eukprot:Skav200266  [mRNA]  locus=scaffold4437:38715:48406:+ [translate_table: standard]
MASAILQQEWVRTWNGFHELEDDVTDEKCLELAERIYAIGQQNWVAPVLTDSAALEKLAEQGFQLVRAQSHGKNNCLIDSLMLCLCKANILPTELLTDSATRKNISCACRQHLMQLFGDSIAPGNDAIYPFLDALTHGPACVRYLLVHFRAVLLGQAVLHVHDRRGNEVCHEFRVRATAGETAATHLHLYNYTFTNGDGYHFDSLIPSARARSPGSVQVTAGARVAARNAKESNETSNADKRAVGTKQQLKTDRGCAVQNLNNLPWLPSGWQLLFSESLDPVVSLLHALLWNLLVHRIITVPRPLSAQDRSNLCEHVALQIQLDRTLLQQDFQNCLYASLDAFCAALDSDAQGTPSVWIYLYTRNTLMFDEPTRTYVIGNANSVIAPICRILLTEVGLYAAALPTECLPDIAPSQATACVEPLLSPLLDNIPRAKGCHPVDEKELPSPQATACPQQVQNILGRFLARRGAEVTVNIIDAMEVLALADDAAALGLKLHTLLQAGLPHADSGIVAMRRLVDAWRGFYACCTQGSGKALGKKPEKNLAAEKMETEIAVAPSLETKYKTASQKETTNAKRKRSKTAASVKVETRTEKKRRKDLVPEGQTDEVATQKFIPHSQDHLEEGPPLDEVYPLQVWSCEAGNQDPRALRETKIQAATEELTAMPLWPTRFQDTIGQRRAHQLPAQHCAFKGCAEEFTSELALKTHICSEHRELLRSVMPRPVTDEGLYQTYLELLTARCQQGAPVANASLDRRCLYHFRFNMLDEGIVETICFVCARRFPFIRGSANNHISWVTVGRADRLFGLALETVDKVLGVATYKQKYLEPLPADARRAFETELDAWTCEIESAEGSTKIVCCPEDKICHGRPKCTLKRLCKKCIVPMCVTCKSELIRHGRKPAEALSNDMVVGYPPRELYVQTCTVLELLTASPCMTALTCFSIEWRYLHDRALGQDAFMNRNRLCAKGCATTFPLPWEDLLTELQRMDNLGSSSTSCLLPHLGKALAERVAVMIKIGKKDDQAEARQKIIHQAVVRRRVVVGLIAAMVARKHPAYAGVNMASVEERAQSLPVEDIPPEVVAILTNDGSLERVQRQKAAAPVNDQLTPEQARREFTRMLKPNAIVLEKTSGGFHDVNAKHVSTLETVVEQTTPVAQTDLQQITLYTGTKLLDQFQPCYFALAFPFVFPYGLGMPDPPQWSGRTRPRRAEDEPYVELAPWVRAMARRVEAQINRDWVFGFTSWNLLFRSALNLSRTTESYAQTFYDEDTQTWVTPTGKHVEAGAKQLLSALKGTYIDVQGKPRAVKGDISKLQYVQGLKPMARKLLRNMRHTAQGLPGTQEARRRMRFEIQAMRIRYGVPLFVTFTPDESHQLLFVRLARVRANDPVRAAGMMQDFPAGDANYPSLNGTPDGSTPFERTFALPLAWAERREIMARDPLAAVDGFRVLMLLMLKHLFGVRCCPRCPDCNQFPGLVPCQDWTGSSAAPNGGIFGRVEAVYVSLEAQKSCGASHGHAQVFVQCLHQHTPLEEIFHFTAEQLDALRIAYIAYNAHVCHATYANQPASVVQKKIVTAEASWPDHETDDVMTTFPTYQLRAAPVADDDEISKDAVSWYEEYLEQDVVNLQALKQHHYHPFCESSGARVPLTGCQKSDRPGVCKSDFPRAAWLCTSGEILCPCRLKAHEMPLTGRKNRLGALHGPYGNEWLNPCAPAMLAGLRGANCDVQIPYRLPYKCEQCGAAPTATELRQIALAAQRAQDAQTGYCADYCSKSQPMGHAEIQEFQRGHEDLQRQHGVRGVEDAGKRHAMRFLSDAYLKSVVRGQVECCNLRAEHRESAVVSAERFSTSPFEAFPGAAFAEAVQKWYDVSSTNSPLKPNLRWTKRQASGKRHLVRVNTVQVYGHRPVNSEVWWLSPYEFTAAWVVCLARIPQTYEEWLTEPKDSWDVNLTPAGSEHVRKAAVRPTKALGLVPGKHFELSIIQSTNRLLLENGSATAVLRHQCWLERRKRPCCPHFDHAPVPVSKRGHAERNARLTMTYFRAWTFDRAAAAANVRFVGHLKEANDSWETSLRAWLTCLPSQTTKQLVGNFLSVYRARPAQEADQNSDDSGVDAPLRVTPKTLPTALTPCFRQQTPTKKKKQTQIDKVVAGYEAAVRQADVTWQCPPQTRDPSLPTVETTPFELLAANQVHDALNQYKTSAAKKRRTAEMRKECPATLEARATETEIATNGCCNAEQEKFLRKVCDRVKLEAVSGQDCGGSADTNTEALRWALHGGPGTGKSYAINLLRQELFEKKLGWIHGKQFQIVAYQAVNADPLDGDTIHKALGLAWHGRDSNIDQQRILNLAQQLVQLRWLIIDEISMLSAEMLARLEAQCRKLISDIYAAKYGAPYKYQVAPFGGLNVILCGDMWQLPPPRGTFLGQIPWQLVTGLPSGKLPLALQGQRLVWAPAAHGGLHGVTELVQCERTRDPWLQEVQTELRRGQLSKENFDFMHGRLTKVPGSWSAIAQGPTCGNRICRKLYQHGSNPATIQAGECEVCRRERASKRLVATGPQDPRFYHELLEGTALFPTNAVKCHVNRVRAEAWARQRGRCVYYVIAQDRVSSMALHEKPDIASDKLQWLQRHDRDCGNRYGVLPVAVGMPVQAREHLYRGNFKILRGCAGEVRGWTKLAAADAAEAVMEPNNQTYKIWNTPPAFIFVRFFTKTDWVIPGIDEPNVFPVTATRADWYLDAGRRAPKLKITRWQFPLAPNFADTYYGIQGSTRDPGVIVDMGEDTIAAYVGMTRCRVRDKVLIYRPFPLAPFQQGVPLGRQLLLDVWRQEPINWEALKAKYIEEKLCNECGERKRKTAFTIAQWRNVSHAVCKECTEKKREAGIPFRCTQCGVWHAETHFSVQQRNPRVTASRVCLTCEATKLCYICQKQLPRERFTAAAWKTRNADRRRCVGCQTKLRGHWMCSSCRQKLPKPRFSDFLRARLSGKDGRQQCNDCRSRHIQDRLRRRSAARAKHRLATLKTKAQRQKIIRETWEEIAAKRQTKQKKQNQREDVPVRPQQKRSRADETLPPNDVKRRKSDASETIPAQKPATQRSDAGTQRTECPVPQAATVHPSATFHTYVCPNCAAAVQSTVTDGTVMVRGHCDYQFRVLNGVVRKQIYRHQCPTCHTQVDSTLQAGQIKAKHKNPKGRFCRTERWYVRL